MTKSNQYERGRSHERSPLGPQYSHGNSYGVFGQTSGPPNIQPPPAYGAPTNPSGGCNITNIHQSQRDSSPPRPDTASAGCCTLMFLIVVVQAVVIICMRRAASEDRVPPGAFWEALPRPAPDCLAYGKREYSGALRNIPKDWTALDACMNMPVEIKGVSFRRPYRCGYAWGSPHIHGYWVVDWNQLDCKPWYQDFHDTVRDRMLNAIPYIVFKRLGRVARMKDPGCGASKHKWSAYPTVKNRIGSSCAKPHP